VAVRSTFVEGSGTLVTKEDRDMEQVVVSGVTGIATRRRSRLSECRTSRGSPPASSARSALPTSWWT